MSGQWVEYGQNRVLDDVEVASLLDRGFRGWPGRASTGTRRSGTADQGPAQRRAAGVQPVSGGAARAGGAVDRQLANAWSLRRWRGPAVPGPECLPSRWAVGCPPGRSRSVNSGAGAAAQHSLWRPRRRRRVAVPGPLQRWRLDGRPGWRPRTGLAPRGRRAGSDSPGGPADSDARCWPGLLASAMSRHLASGSRRQAAPKLPTGGWGYGARLTNRGDPRPRRHTNR
jgi:hypothetical protein